MNGAHAYEDIQELKKRVSRIERCLRLPDLAPIIDNLTQAAATAELAETMTGEEVARMLREVAEQLGK